MARIDKEIFPGLMISPFHYACFTKFTGYSEDRFYTVHNNFQVIIGLSGVLHFEIEGEKRSISQQAGSVFVLSPGIRHRWHSEAGKTCENFMFFCDGFTETDSDLGSIFNLNQPGIIWHFELEPEEYAFYIDNFRNLVRNHDCCNSNIMHGLLYAFCGMICRRANKIYAPLGQGKQHPSLTRAIKMINSNYREQITLNQLSLHCGLGPSRLSELFRHAFGMSPMQYVNDLRVKKARQLLGCSDMNVSQISEYLGFSSVHYFSRFFRSHTGMQPSSIASSKS
ncbi:MAG: AraC family transcriptional regulator [Victivallales bacterium]